nr:hypothetical protein [Tanacetum cinerariifolium]
MFDCDDYLSSGSDESFPPSPIYDRYSIQHDETSIPPMTVIPKPTSNGKSKNRKACFVCKSLDHLIKEYDYHEKKMAQPTARNHAHRGNHKHYALMTHQNPQRHMVPAAVLTQSKLVPITAVRPVCTAIPKISVTRPRHAKPVVTKPNSPPKRHINRSPSPEVNNSPPRVTVVKAPVGNPQHALKDKGVIDSRCSRHMTGNMSYLFDFEELNGGYVAFGGNPKGGKIFGKGKIKTGKLDFNDVYFVKELKFNLFSVSQMCDKMNSVLFTDTECLALYPEFKLPDASQVLLRVNRENNIYNVNLKNIVPSGDLSCLFAKATIDESNLWHSRLGHINFKTMNNLVKGNLVRGLPTKVFENDNACVACKKGKQHRASYDYIRFTLVFFLATKDETSPFLKTFITGLENQLNLIVKVIKSDNGTKFKNHDLNQFCGIQGIKRKFSVPRTPQQNGIAERKNKTLIEAARTILADSLLLIPFWADAVNTACYVQNRVLVTKPHNKTPYELLHGRTPRYRDLSAKFADFSDNSINEVNAAGTLVPTVGKISLNNTNTFSAAGPSNVAASPTHRKSSYDVGAEADFNNLETSIIVSPIPTRGHKDHHVTQIIGDLSSATQTRSMAKEWLKIKEELLQFKMQKVWVLVDLSYRKRAIGTKWVFRNKKDERGIVVRNKARLVAQGHTQEEGFNYE